MDGAVLLERVWGAEFDLARVSLEYGVEGVDHGDEGGFFTLFYEGGSGGGLMGVGFEGRGCEVD